MGDTLLSTINRPDPHIQVYLWIECVWRDPVVSLSRLMSIARCHADYIKGRNTDIE